VRLTGDKATVPLRLATGQGPGGKRHPEVRHCQATTTGNADLVPRVASADMTAYDRFFNEQLSALVEVSPGGFPRRPAKDQERDGHSDSLTRGI